MITLKNTLYAFFILALGVYASYAFLDATATTQKEREASFISKANQTRVGQSVRLGNGSFLKISEVEK